MNTIYLLCHYTLYHFFNKEDRFDSMMVDFICKTKKEKLQFEVRFKMSQFVLLIFRDF